MSETLKKIHEDAIKHAKETGSHPDNATYYCRLDFAAGAISERNKLLSELQNICGHNDRIEITADYLESLKIPTK